MRCTVFLLYYIQKKDQFVKSNTENFERTGTEKGGNIMRISKQTKKTTLAQQGRYLLICLLSMLLLFLAGSVLILNRTQRQVYEQLEEISKLYTDELDNRFFSNQPKPVLDCNGQLQPGFCVLEIYGSDGEGSV